MKLAKKEPTKPAAKKATTTAKPAAPKKEKPAAKKAVTKTSTKKAAAPKKTATAKTKANVAKPRKAPVVRYSLLIS